MPEHPRSERKMQNRVIALFADLARPDLPPAYPSGLTHQIGVNSQLLLFFQQTDEVNLLEILPSGA